MLRRGNPDRWNTVKYSENEEFLHSNILNFAYQLYSFYDSCSKTESIITEIINDAKQCYLEGEEE